MSQKLPERKNDGQDPVLKTLRITGLILLNISGLLGVVQILNHDPFGLIFVVPVAFYDGMRCSQAMTRR